MINFCHSCLRPVITCDKVCADDYGVENLVAGQDFWTSQRGFRTERFIIPPVCVTIQFPCKVNIANIIIDPVVGRQKSCGFEIFTSQRPCSSWLQVETKNDKTANKNSSIIDDEVFVMIGKERMAEAVMVCFENPFYRAHGQFSEFKQKPITAEKRFILRHSRSSCLTAVSSVRIRIVSTVDRSSPALKRLEIWGQPSSSCFRHIQRRIYELYKTALRSTVTDLITVSSLYDGDSNKSCDKAADNNTISLKNIEDNHITIPEDFIDPITCDIMTIPLTLPSGKTVDQLTLDKHINAEAMWGRPPSDPFTGVPFNDFKKPVSNIPLKVRIDQFALTHSSQLKSVPRVLGRANKHNLSESANPPTATIVNQNGVVTGRTLKRKFELTQDGCKTKAVQMKSCKPNVTGTKLSGNHETVLTESLDAALFAALGTLPSFQSAKPTVQTDCFSNSAQTSLCINCQVTGDYQNLYKLLCGHVICKKCLTNLLSGSKSGICPACSTQFLSKDVVRFNL